MSLNLERVLIEEEKESSGVIGNVKCRQFYKVIGE